jgi:hypothetical protein
VARRCRACSGRELGPCPGSRAASLGHRRAPEVCGFLGLLVKACKTNALEDQPMTERHANRVRFMPRRNDSPQSRQSTGLTPAVSTVRVAMQICAKAKVSAYVKQKMLNCAQMKPIFAGVIEGSTASWLIP